MPESDKSLSLNAMVRGMEDQIQGADALEKLSEKLAKAGYVELREYDSPEFVVAEENTYRVTKEFPRLIRSEVPEGIVRVGYEIQLEAIRSFLCSADKVWG